MKPPQSLSSYAGRHSGFGRSQQEAFRKKKKKKKNQTFTRHVQHLLQVQGSVTCYVAPGYMSASTQSVSQLPGCCSVCGLPQQACSPTSTTLTEHTQNQQLDRAHRPRGAARDDPKPLHEDVIGYIFKRGNNPTIQCCSKTQQNIIYVVNHVCYQLLLVI